MLAETIAFVIQLYAAVGCVFAGAFVVSGAPRLDPAARGGGWPFRLVIAPGAVALWPYLAVQWRRRDGVRR